jgi:hypothetical protein
MSKRSFQPLFALSFALSLAMLLASPLKLAADELTPNELTPNELTPNELTPNELTAGLDRYVQDRWAEQQIRPAAPCSDQVFVRRVYLDLAGRVPTIAEAESFLDDSGSDRRARLVDMLLSSEDHVQHFADLFDALLMGRGSESKYAQREKHHWRGYLETVIRENRPWDQVSSEILRARPTDTKSAGAVWYLYERNNDHQQIAESIAPAFFGVRIECAQCHDHMTADEIKQEHYWGLVAFFNRSQNADTPSGPAVAESAIGGFSEFADIYGESSPNVLSFLGAPEVAEPRPTADEKQQDADSLYHPAAADQPRIPHFSRREKFVSEVVANHPLLARAMVNRIWAMLMGRGIVHPFDEMDSVHPPSHPELLDWLSRDFADHGYDLRRLIRSIVLCEAYQLDSIRPADVNDPASFAWYLERPLTAEQLARSIQLVIRGGVDGPNELLGLFRQQFKEVLPDDHVVSAGDTLFLSNNAPFHRFLAESDQSPHLVPQLLEMDDDDAARIDRLFRTIFGRPASDDEQQVIVQYLGSRGESPPLAWQQIVWSMLTSAEFRFNH